MAINPNLRPISTYERKNFEDMGEAFVRQACNSNYWPKGQDGSPHPTQISGLIWLAELDEAQLERTEALQTRQTRLAKIAAYASIGAVVVGVIGIVVMIILWRFPRY
jgi:hypothetical protein